MAFIDLTKSSEESKDGKKPAVDPTPNGDALEAAAAGGALDESLLQLRQIIFGNRMSEFEEEVVRLENRIASESALVRQEVEELGRRLEKRITEIDTRATKGHSDLREQLLSQSNLLTDAIQERAEQAMNALNQGLQEVRESKLDNKTLANLLVNLATEITTEPASGNGGVTQIRTSWRPARSSN